MKAVRFTESSEKRWGGDIIAPFPTQQGESRRYGLPSVQKIAGGREPLHPPAHQQGEPTLQIFSIPVREYHQKEQSSTLNSRYNLYLQQICIFWLGKVRHWARRHKSLLDNALLCLASFRGYKGESYMDTGYFYCPFRLSPSFSRSADSRSADSQYGLRRFEANIRDLKAHLVSGIVVPLHDSKKRRFRPKSLPGIEKKFRESLSEPGHELTREQQKRCTDYKVLVCLEIRREVHKGSIN